MFCSSRIQNITQFRWISKRFSWHGIWRSFNFTFLLQNRSIRMMYLYCYHSSWIYIYHKLEQRYWFYMNNHFKIYQKYHMWLTKLCSLKTSLRTNSEKWERKFPFGMKSVSSKTSKQANESQVIVESLPKLVLPLTKWGFLWEWDNKEGGGCWVGWKKSYAIPTHGGLEMGDLWIRNSDLLMLWRFACNNSTFWTKIIRRIYWAIISSWHSKIHKEDI